MWKVGDKTEAGSEILAIEKVSKGGVNYKLYTYRCVCGKIDKKLERAFNNGPLCHKCMIERIRPKHIAEELEKIGGPGSFVNGFKILGLFYEERAVRASAQCPVCGKVFKTRWNYIKKSEIEKCKECTWNKGHKTLEEARVFETNVISIMPNRELNKNNTSGHTGVSWNKTKGKWVARIQFQKNMYYLGAFENIDDAIKARKEAEKEIYGNFLEWYSQNYPENWEKIKKAQEKKQAKKEKKSGE